MNRRLFVKTLGAALATGLFYSPTQSFASNVRLQNPDGINALIGDKQHHLNTKDGYNWIGAGLDLRLQQTDSTMGVDLHAPGIALSKVTLTWKITHNRNTQILNDHWERTYGDVSWHKLANSEPLPWYFLEINNGITHGFGVKTGGNCFCYWTITTDKLELTLDTRSGSEGVVLNDRILRAADIVIMKGIEGESQFAAAKRFMHLMCDNPRMPKQPVYGINDWYFSYGNTSEALILEHTAMMAPLAEGLKNRPFSVIDAGWFASHPKLNDDCCWGDNMHTPDKKFGDMGELAQKIRNLDMRPGIWTRPLCASHKDPATLLLPSIQGRNDANKPVLDPSIPENLERIKNYFKLYNEWSYELVKFDFTTYDFFGRWGYEMLPDKRMTQGHWQPYNKGKTNAEIIMNLYRSIRVAAGETYLIGCNTISHFSAGLVELNRIGDDTSGHEWERTRKMGVNTLAFRGVHHGSFYAADADCVGLTNKVDWKKNKQWMELLAKSGTPLFISAQPDATGAEQKAAIRACFALAATELPLGEPLDWIENSCPATWKLNGKIEKFDWS